MCGMKVAQRRLTYTELRHFPDDGRRYELIEGVLYENGEEVPPERYPPASEAPMTPAPSEKHQRLSSKLFVSLYLYVEAKGLGRVYYAPLDVALSDRTTLQPDIVFVSSSRLGIIGPEYLIGPPDLVVEILSPFRAKYDRITKSETYARHGVAEYWILDPIAETVEIFRLTEGRYQQSASISGDQFIQTPLLPGWRVAALDLFIG